jgi:excisionase family DNA binding protein
MAPLASRSTSGIERLLTVEEVAELLALSPKTIYAWAGSRRIPSLRLGRSLRFSEKDLKAWLDSRQKNLVS